MSIPGLDSWFASAPGRYVLDWEQACLDESVADIFGFNALQIGLPQCNFLRASRIPLRQKAGLAAGSDIVCDPRALPFAANSVDLVILPHMLEFSEDPHQILREVERVLIPEGQLIVVGFNPYSLWGLRKVVRRSGDFPWRGSYLSLQRLRDWLKLLSFDVERGSFGCYLPPVDQQKWLNRWYFMERAGRRWWNISGAVYMLRAVKRTHGMRLITPNWKKKAVRAKALRPIAQKEKHDG